ncbi:MAG: hypothetical protein FJ135_07785 [Deltaproteobacteria bacterium]|nr:hypothetical protein [Deltaproteobacteria bacterium]
MVSGQWAVIRDLGLVPKLYLGTPYYQSGALASGHSERREESTDGNRLRSLTMFRMTLAAVLPGGQEGFYQGLLVRSVPFKKLRKRSKVFFIGGTRSSIQRTRRSKIGTSMDNNNAPRARKSQPCRIGSTSPGIPRRIRITPTDMRTIRLI